MGEVALLSLTAALNPTLLAATTVMLLLPQPERLMLGYYLGAMLTGITLGLVIAFTLQGSSFVSTSKKTLSPLLDLALATIAVIAAVVLATSTDQRRDQARARRRPRPKKAKKPPKWQQAMRKGTAKTTFVIGILLSFPGASYLAGLDRLSKLHLSTFAIVATVIAFNLVQLILIEIPIVAFNIAPQRTPIAIEHAKAWGKANWRQYAVWGLIVIAAALTIKGIVALVQ